MRVTSFVMKYKEITTSQALSKTSINLADRVLNPYRGCHFGCLYCYASRLKSSLKSDFPWGTFVEVKINISNQLERELRDDVTTSSILIGSTTEIYQPIEKDYRLMNKILKIIKKYGRTAILLTRSPLILIDLDLISSMNHRIYFTVTPEKIFHCLEPHSPHPSLRMDCIKKMIHAGIHIIPYICPLIPGYFDMSVLFSDFLQIGISEIHFENVNLKVLEGSFNDDTLAKIKDDVKKIYAEEKTYLAYWSGVKDEMNRLSQKFNIRSKMFIHSYNSYCSLDYSI